MEVLGGFLYQIFVSNLSVLAHRHLRPSLLFGPTPSHSILRNSLQVGETLPIKRQYSFHNHHPHQSYNNQNLVLSNVKRGGELIGVDMLLLDSKATLMPGSSPSHHLQTALKGGDVSGTLSMFDSDAVSFHSHLDG
ncbi:hypothetical protein YC2023_054040 [Brassica napus]